MSHFRQHALKSVAVIALLATSIPSVTAQAESRDIDYPGLKTAAGKNQTQTAPLSAFTSPSPKPVLDWQNPNYTVKFDVPETDWTSSLRLSLSADPVGNMPRSAEIYVKFNQAAPIKVVTKGRGFDAALSLETTGIRSRGNVLNIYYAAPTDSNCLQSRDGGWALNLDESKLTLQSRAKSRNLIVSDIEAELSNPLTAPRRVSLVSYGKNKTQLQSLLAQAVGMRLEKAVELTSISGAGQIEFIAGRRDQISRFVRNDGVMSSTGPRLAFDEGRPMRVILTGDTDEQVLSLVKSFSQHSLPNTRRTVVSTGEIQMQTKLSADTILNQGQTKLTDFKAMQFEPDYNLHQTGLRFDVADPIASRGEVLLKLEAREAILGEKNSATLFLNGQPIGQTTLNKTQKSVAFQVPSHALRGQDNILKLEPYFDTSTLNECDAQTFRSNGIYIGEGSNVTLSQDRETPLSDLSRMTATGAPFSDAAGKNTLLVLPENDADYFAALELLMKFAKSSGNAWSEAVYIRGSEQIETSSEGRNVLFIVPSHELPASAKTTAPKSLISALRGKPENGENLLSVSANRYTSSNSKSVHQNFVMRTAEHNRIDRGGIAALFVSPYQSNKMVGIISDTSGAQFAEAIETFSEPDHWNKMQGQVARWNKKSVLMTELSSPLPYFERAHMPDSVSKFGFSAVKLSNVVFTLPEVSLPHIGLPEVNWGRVKNTIHFWETEAETPPANISKASSELDLRLIADKPVTGKNSSPMIKQNWGARQFSAAAFLLILLFGLALVFLGLSEPRSRAKEYR